MDRELRALELRRAADPLNLELTASLARRYAQIGRRLDAFWLLHEHPKTQASDPLLRELGQVIAREQAPRVARIDADAAAEAGRRFFAVRKALTGRWDWCDRWGLKKRPVLAVSFSYSSWSRVKHVAACGLLSLRFLRLRGAAIEDGDLALLAPLTALRELDLSECHRLGFRALEAVAALPRLERLLWGRPEERGAMLEAFPKLDGVLV